jgi:predicted ATP-dependent serine protease
MMPFSESRMPLCGREAELQLLTGLLDAVERSGAALVLRGDPGIGKSRLLAEAMSLAGRRNMSVLAGTGSAV